MGYIIFIRRYLKNQRFKKLEIGIEKNQATAMNTLIIQSQLLELYPKHMEICYPMHTTEIPILTSWSNTCYAIALIIIYKHHDIAQCMH